MRPDSTVPHAAARVPTSATELMAKQKLKGYYGSINERQFRRIYQEAARRKGDTSENLIGLLESRLDTVVYRMGVVPTVFAARQFVSHGHVLVNGKRVNIASYSVQEGDVVEVREKARQMPMVVEMQQNPERSVPDYIEFDSKDSRPSSSARRSSPMFPIR